MGHSKSVLIRFFISCFAVSWILWCPGVASRYGLLSINPAIAGILKLAGSCVPAIAALGLVRTTEGKGRLRHMIGSCFRPGRSVVFLASAVVFLAGIHLAAHLVYKSISEVPPPASTVVTSPASALAFFMAAFFIGGGLGEEIGWRGFALPFLQNRFGGLAASLILSTFWIFWHLPLFFYEGTNQTLIPFWIFIITVYPLGILLTLIYNRSGTIFAAALFHTVGNLSHELFPVLPSAENPSLTGFLVLTAFYSISALAVLAIWGGHSLGRPKELT